MVIDTNEKNTHFFANFQKCYSFTNASTHLFIPFNPARLFSQLLFNITF